MAGVVEAGERWLFPGTDVLGHGTARVERQPEGGLIGLGGSPESGASNVRRVGSEPHQKRHMLRLWLKFPKPWPLSPEFPTHMGYKPSQDTPVLIEAER